MGAAHLDGKVGPMQPPGTHRVSDGSRVEFPAAIAAWTSAARPVPERLAGSYHATITYKELGEEVQEVTGIKTRVLLMSWSRVELFEQVRRDQRAGDLRSGSWLGPIMCTGGRRG